MKDFNRQIGKTLCTLIWLSLAHRNKHDVQLIFLIHMVFTSEWVDHKHRRDRADRPRHDNLVEIQDGRRLPLHFPSCISYPAVHTHAYWPVSVPHMHVWKGFEQSVPQLFRLAMVQLSSCLSENHSLPVVTTQKSSTKACK